MSFFDRERSSIAMTVDNMSVNKLLLLSGALAVVAGVLVFAVPEQTAAAVTSVAERVGLQTPQVGVKIVEPVEDDAKASPAAGKRQRRAASSSLSGDKSVKASVSKTESAG